MEFILELDERICLLLNGFNAEFADPIMKMYSSRFIWIFLYVAIAGVMIRYYGLKKGIMLIAACGIAVGLTDFVCASVLRPFFQRLRPSNLENEISALVHIVDGYRSGSYGFPSCHAGNSFALAIFTLLAFRSRPYTIFIMLWALLQCYSRVYLGVHYPGDLAVGALIGSAFAYAAYSFCARHAGTDRHRPKEGTTPAIAVGVVLCVVIVVKCLI